jgi:hypothetical protein
MHVRNFALVAGIVYLLVGLMGLLGIGVVSHGATHNLVVDAQYGRLLGLFPVNVLHNIFHLAIGLWGIAVYRSWEGSRVYSKSLAIVYGVLTVMGLFPVLNTFFGLIPLYGHDIWLHAVTAGAAAYFGWATVPARTRVTA